LDVDGLEHAREAGVEDGVEMVSVMQDDEGGIDSFRLKVAKECSGNGSHSLDIAARGAI